MKTICYWVAATLFASLGGCSTQTSRAVQPLAPPCVTNWLSDCRENIYREFIVSGNCRVEDGDDILKEHASQIADWEPEYFDSLIREGDTLLVSYVLPDRRFAERYAMSIDVFIEGGVCSKVEAGLILR